jgi:Domain of unknown function (DUF4440)
MSLLKSALALSLVLSFALSARAAFAQSYLNEQAAWKLERAFCDDTNSGNLAAAMNLVDPDFLGWGVTGSTPMHKADLANTLARTLADRAASKTHSISFAITPVAGHAVGNMVVLEYTVTDILVDKAHHTTESHSRVSHTWIQRGDTWKMLGGMSSSASEIRLDRK